MPNLKDLNNNELRAAVDDYIRGRVSHRLGDRDADSGSPEILDQLRQSPEVLDRWYYTLIELKRSVESQLAARRADTDAKQSHLLSRSDTRSKNEWLTVKGDFETWRGGALRFKNGVETALLEAKSLRGQSGVDSALADRDRYIHKVQVLLEAIRKHQDHDCNQTDCPDDRCLGDEELWGTLEGS